MSRPRLSVPFPKTVEDYRANFARNQMRDFRAPDWTCILRDNLTIDPLRGLSVIKRDGLGLFR